MYYQTLFTLAPSLNLDEVLAIVPEMITEELNSMLTTEFVKAEVDEALKQMESLKAPSPDGLPPLFFKQFWPYIREDVSYVVLTCLNTGFITSSINFTFITLIPKVKCPSRVLEF